MNPFYNPQTDDEASSYNKEPHVLYPSLHPDCFRLWTKMYSPYDMSGVGNGGGAPLESIYTRYVTHNFYLADHIKQIQEQVTNLSRLCGSSAFENSDGSNGSAVAQLTASTEVLFKQLGINQDVYDCSAFTGDSPHLMNPLTPTAAASAKAPVLPSYTEPNDLKDPLLGITPTQATVLNGNHGAISKPGFSMFPEE